MDTISLIIPSRNNLKYLKWAYTAVRKNQGTVNVEVCVADDASTDGTWEWCEEVMQSDKMFKALRNEGPSRLGHTILYDRLINTVATGDIIGIYHADMYLCPGTLEKVLDTIKPKTAVSLTRIEPPLHPAGPEKVVVDFATEPEDFNEFMFLEWFNGFYINQAKGKVTEGIFAPWFVYKKDFQEIGGHDILYAPQSKEDSDIFNRMLLAGYEFVQIWEGAVYHMTCRGSRFNPTLTKPGQNSTEWEIQNKRSERNFIRKWGNVPFHDMHMKPIVTPHHHTTIKVVNATLPIVRALEPWASEIVIDNYDAITAEYIPQEQPYTLFDLKNRIHHIEYYKEESANILISLDTLTFTGEDFALIQQFEYQVQSILKQVNSTLPVTLTNSTGTVKYQINQLVPLESNFTFNN